MTVPSAAQQHHPVPCGEVGAGGAGDLPDCRLFGMVRRADLIDWTACDGRGLCVELLPELLDADEWGYPLIYGEAEVAARLADHAERAVKACPKRALRLAPNDRTDPPR